MSFHENRNDYITIFSFYLVIVNYQSTFKILSVLKSLLYNQMYIFFYFIDYDRLLENIEYMMIFQEVHYGNNWTNLQNIMKYIVNIFFSFHFAEEIFMA